MPPEAGGKLFVLFRPGTSETTAFAAILGAGGAPVRLVWGGLGWIAYGEREGFAGRLEEQGALFAFRRAPLGVSFAGCLGTAGDPSGRPPPSAATLKAPMPPCRRMDAPLSASIDAGTRRGWRQEASVVTQECVTFARTEREHARHTSRSRRTINRIDE